MFTTTELLGKYLSEEIRPNYVGISIDNYEITDGFITIHYRYDDYLSSRFIDTHDEVDLLDYITWLFNNSKK